MAERIWITRAYIKRIRTYQYEYTIILCKTIPYIKEFSVNINFPVIAVPGVACRFRETTSCKCISP